MVFELLRDLVCEALGCDESEVTLRSDLCDDLGLSEGELAEILEAMASELGFRTADVDLEENMTAAQLVRCISGLI